MHYGSYKISEVAVVARHYLKDQAARQRISAAARRLVLAKHTWRDRARQVMRDIDLAPSAAPDLQRSQLAQAKDALNQIALGAPKP